MRTTLFLLLLLSVPAVCLSQVGISPAYYDLSLAEAGKTQTFRLFNYTSEAKQVRVSLAPWDADANNQPRLLPPGPTTLDQWVVVNPIEFEVKAKSSQAIRFSVRPAVELTPGEHRVMLVFDEVVSGNEGAKMRSRFQFRSAVYVQSGEIHRQGDIEAIMADGDGLHLRMHNTGNANVRFSGQYSLWRTDKYPGTAATDLVPGLANKKPDLAPGQLMVDALPGSPVLPGDTHTLSAGFGQEPLAPGSYTVDINGTLGETALDRSVEFTIPKPNR